MKSYNACGISVLNPVNVEKDYLDFTVDYAIKLGFNHFQLIGPIHNNVRGNVDGMVYYKKYSQFNNEKDSEYVDYNLEVACLLSICLVMIKPIVEIILKTSNIMNSVSKFMISYIPIITGIMYATGQSLLGSSYSTVMILFSEFIMQISSKILIPILNIFLAISITSSMPTTCSFSNVCSFFSKTAKWIIGISTVVFVGILTIQSVITSAADNIGTKTLKFMLSGSVPVVGKTLGDALLVINGSVKLLKSGVGAFFLLAVGVIFIPVILDCLTFKIVSAISLNLSETFGITSASKLIKNTTEVLNLLLIIVLCCLIVLLVSTSLIILINPLNL